MVPMAGSDGKRYKTKVCVIILLANDITPLFVLYYSDGERYKAMCVFPYSDGKRDKTKVLFYYYDGRRCTTLHLYNSDEAETQYNHCFLFVPMAHLLKPMFFV